MSQTTLTRNNASITKMNLVLNALRQYEAANGELPCPADASQPAGSSTYGIAAQNSGPATNCTGGTPSANYVDSANNVAIGMLPVKTMGLSSDYAMDAYGRMLTYVVDTHATQCFSGTLQGQITVTDNGVPTNTVAVLVSHGKDGHGAWVPLSGSGGTAARLNAGSTDPDQLTNAHVDASFTPTATLSNFIKKIPTPAFDDLVVYKSPAWNLNTLPPETSAALIPTITPPSNGVYIAGQTLAFGATYRKTTLVNGLPRLTTLIGTATRFANYVTGTNTPTLTFSYTLQSSDYAPAGISLNASIDLNGGSLSPACTSFSVPVLSGVQVKNMYVYVADYSNNRVQKFDARGNYLGQFGSYGLLGGLFNHPDQLAIDGSGNVWVTDFGNSRVEKFNDNGVYQMQFGTLGILNGQFINAASIAADSSGNLWVSDSGNNRVQKFNGSGAYLSQFGSVGTGNGQFLVPSGVSVDSSGNIWVGDWGNGRIEEFNGSGSYVGKFGSVGTGNGQFINPCGQAFDSSGNIWLADYGNNRMEKFTGGGSYIAQFGASGSGNGQFNGPCGVAVDVAGNLWVGDTGNNRVEKFDSSGNYLGEFGSSGSGNGQFQTPMDLALYYQ